MGIESGTVALLTLNRGVHCWLSNSGFPLTGEELRDQDISEDEDLSPDQPSFVGLFKPQQSSLLHKAKTTTHLGLARPAPATPGEDVTSAFPLFEEPTFEVEEIPGPKFFRDVLQRQWSSPVSGPNANVVDRHLYNLAPDISALFQVLSVDPPGGHSVSSFQFNGSA